MERKEKMKQFPFEFNEEDFIIHDFAKMSMRRGSNSEDRLSGSETTEASGNLSDVNHLSNSDEYSSDTGNDFYLNSQALNKMRRSREETKNYGRL